MNNNLITIILFLCCNLYEFNCNSGNEDKQGNSREIEVFATGK